MLDYELNRRANSPKGYDIVDAANPTVPNSGNLAMVRKAPGVEELFQSASLADKLDPVAPSAFRSSSAGDAIDPAKSLGLTEMQPVGADAPASFRTVKRFQDALDGKAKAAFRAGDGALDQQYSNMSRSVADHLDAHLADFNLPAVRAKYSAMLRNEQALTNGAKDYARSLDPEAIRSKFNALSAPEQDAYRKGLGAGFIKMMRSQAPGANVPTSLLDPYPPMRAKLKIAFPTPEALDDFLARAQAGDRLSQLALPASARMRRPPACRRRTCCRPAEWSCRSTRNTLRREWRCVPYSSSAVKPPSRRRARRSASSRPQRARPPFASTSRGYRLAKPRLRRRTVHARRRWVR